MQISDYPLPDRLSDAERAEFEAYRASLVVLERNFEMAASDSSLGADYADEMVQKIRQRREIAEEERKIKREIVERQYEEEKRTIDEERAAYKKLLFERLVRVYAQAYNSSMEQLKELMGRDFPSFYAANMIEFPIIPPDAQLKAKMQQPEDTKIRASSEDAENDLRTIQRIIQEAEI